MPTNISLQTSNNQGTQDTQVFNILPNLNVIQRNFEIIENAINKINGQLAGVIPTSNVTRINTANFDGFMTGLSGSVRIQGFADAVDDRVGANLPLDVSGLNNSLNGFRTQAGAKNVQTFMEFCDRFLQPLIPVVPTIADFRLNIPMVQTAPFNLFTNIPDAMRTFNATINMPGDFSQFNIFANDVRIASFNTLAASSRAVQIPIQNFSVAGWNRAVAAATEDASGRDIINMVLLGTRTGSEGGSVSSNTIQLLIGAPAQQETIYWGLFESTVNPITEPINNFSSHIDSANPLTVDLRFSMISSPTTSTVQAVIMVPSRFDVVNLLQITPLGDLQANSYFQNFNMPGTRTVGSETYNVYIYTGLVPAYTAVYRLTALDS